MCGSGYYLGLYCCLFVAPEVHFTPSVCVSSRDVKTALTPVGLANPVWPPLVFLPLATKAPHHITSHQDFERLLVTQEGTVLLVHQSYSWSLSAPNYRRMYGSNYRYWTKMLKPSALPISKMVLNSVDFCCCERHYSTLHRTLPGRCIQMRHAVTSPQPHTYFHALRWYVGSRVS